MARTTHPVARRRLCYLPAIALSVVFLLSGSARTAHAGVLPFTVNVSTSPAVGGPYLTDQRGMTLYVSEFDRSGVSNCNNLCLTFPPYVYSPLPPPATGAPAEVAASPALAVPPEAQQQSDGTPTLDPMARGSLSVITRADGSQQVAYNGIPLYLYSGDRNPGDTRGQSFLGSANASFYVASLANVAYLAGR